jgi:RecA/RadA recombinase
MSSLLEKMMSAGTIKGAETVAKSKFFAAGESVPTDLPILNVAFSGTVEGGLIPGLTVIAGESKSFKTLLSLYCMKAYLDKYKDGIALLYDSEFGITPEYLAAFQLDLNRIVHIPITDVEQLKFDIVQKLKAVQKNDRLFIMIDSIGNLASVKEVEDAESEKSVSDMSRAKSFKSLFRIITPHLTIKKIPCIAINHVYKELGLYPKSIVGGGTGIYYSANQIFIITKSQDKDGDDIVGWKFTINIEKSRFVKEKSKLPFTVRYDGGIQKWSSLFELAMEAGFIVKPLKGWYNIADPDTGELNDKNYRQADVEKNDDFFLRLLTNKSFKQFVEHKFKLSPDAMAIASAEDGDGDGLEL